MADVTKLFPSFIFDAFVVRTDWGRAHPDIVVAFIKSYAQGVRWLYDPANRARAIEMLVQETNAKDEDVAKTYDLFVQKQHIFSSSGIVQSADIATVIEALVKLNQIAAPAPPPARFFDNRYAETARTQLQRSR